MVNYWIISRINISRFYRALQIRNFNVLKLVRVFFLDLRNEIIYPESHFCESHWLLPCFVTTCSLFFCVFLFTCVGEAEWGARSYPPAVCGMAGPRCTWWPLRFPDVHQLSKREEERWRAINGTLQVTHTHTHTDTAIIHPIASVLLTLCSWRYPCLSAGIGRTGVLITMETALTQLDEGRPVFPLDIVKTLRDQRAMMVQTTVLRITAGMFDFILFPNHFFYLHHNSVSFYYSPFPVY